MTTTTIRSTAMKQFTFYLAALMLGVFLLGTSNYVQAQSKLKKPAKVQRQTQKQKVVYTCPMDPEVRSDKPGKCPKCNMNLEKKIVRTDAKAIVKTEKYSCPMHPEEKSDKPGKCSKCGMDLEKVKK